LLYNLSLADWDPWLLDTLEISQALLPEVRASSGDFGVARGEALGIEAPIAGVAGDQQAALFGQGCWSPGLAKTTYGTGAFLLMHTGDRIVSSKHGLLTTAACDSRGGLAFALEGSVFIAGAAIQWLRDGLGLIDDASESEAIAAVLESNAGVYFVPAFVGLGAPHWVPDARGAIFGLTRGTTREHLVRAALEAMAYGTHEVLEAMEADSSTRLTELRVDGGAAMNDWLLGFQAGLLGVPVRRPDVVETTALGAAGLAGVAVGIWPNADDFLASQGGATRFTASMSDSERTTLLAGWAEAVQAVKKLAEGGARS
jgi:glycerol kinase